MTVDVEALVSGYLHVQTEVTDLVADRIYTELPHDRTYPLVQLGRTGGGFLINRPQWLDQAEVEINAYGTTHFEAHQVMSATLVSLTDMPGAHTQGCVTKVNVTDLFYNPDPDASDASGHARPRFSATVVVLTHP